jgi:hypothetical protein
MPAEDRALLLVCLQAAEGGRAAENATPKCLSVFNRGHAGRPRRAQQAI